MIFPYRLIKNIFEHTTLQLSMIHEGYKLWTEMKVLSSSHGFYIQIIKTLIDFDRYISGRKYMQR